MAPRFLSPLVLLLCAGCRAPLESGTTSAPVPLSSLPRHRRLAEAQRLAQAVLLAPAPSVAELDTDTARFAPPAPGSIYANYLAYLKPLPPGRGLLVLEPQNTSDPFFAGCARWLRFHCEGSTAFGTSATWRQPDDVRRARSWESLALERGRAVQLGRALDVSAVAIGSVKNGALSYQLLDVSKMPSRVVGTFSRQGTPAQIAAQLPSLARQIAGAAGAPSLAPPRDGMAPADLRFIGALPYRVLWNTPFSAAQKARLKSLASTPLGAMFADNALPNDPAALQVGARTLLARAPTNALAGAELGLNYGGTQTPRRVAVLRALTTKFPHHAALCLGQAQLLEEQEDYFAQVHYSEMAARISPHAALAWDELAQALGNQADQKRQGKYYGEMTRDEKIEVEKIYPRAQVAAWKSVQLEPGDARFWETLSNASTFASDSVWARSALARSLSIDPHQVAALNWGLQIFQPKWFGDNASFAKMARIAVEDARGADLDVDALTDGLERTNQQALKRPLLQILLKNEPDNVPALIECSNALRMETGDSKAALPLARRAVQLQPDNIFALGELGDIEQHDLGQYAQAVAHMRRAAELDPQQGVLWVNLALALAKWGKRDEARAMALKGRALGYTGPHPAWNMVGLSPEGSPIKPSAPAHAASS